MTFPEHKCGLYLTHNEHRDNYEKIENYIKDNEIEFDSPEEKQKSIDSDEIWVLQWYPNTPVSFIYFAAASLEEVLRLANKGDKK